MPSTPRPGKGLPSSRRWLACALALAGLVLSAEAGAQASVPGNGHGSVGIAMQQLYVKYHLDYRGNKIDAGSITSDTVFLNLDYGITERLAINVSLPYVRKKYVGHAPHNFDAFDDGHEDHVHLDNIDDGHWQGGWQDVSVALRYNWRSEPWLVTPFLSYNAPVRDYQYFGHAAIGAHQWRVEAGVDVAHRFEPPLQDLYFQGGYGYSKTQEILGIDADYSTLNLELGYFTSPRWTVRALATARKTHGGLDFPIDFPRRDDELFLNHDRIQRVDYIELGAGASYQLDAQYSLYGTVMRTVWGENGHATDYAVTIGAVRGF
jgi:hypothetical protein